MSVLYKIFEANGEISVQPLGALDFNAKYYPIARELTASVTNVDRINIQESAGSLLFKNIRYDSFVQKDGITTYGATAALVSSALNAIFTQKNFNEFIVKDNSADNSGTTKIRHKVSATGADRDEAGTLELGIGEASIGFYESYLKVSTDTVISGASKATSFGRFELQLQNQVSVQSVMDIAMGNVTQGAIGDFNFASLDISHSATLSNGQVEVDFSTTPIESKEFTILDSSVTLTSNISAAVAYEAPTGKELDEIEMDNLQIRCGQPSAGSFKMFINAADGSYLADKFKINYIITL